MNNFVEVRQKPLTVGQKHGIMRSALMRACRFHNHKVVDNIIKFHESQIEQFQFAKKRDTIKYFHDTCS